MAPDGDCLICAMEDADDAVVVARDHLWACEIVPGYEVPGWFVLRTRRHALGLPGLTAEELATFGPRARRGGCHRGDRGAGHLPDELRRELPALPRPDRGAGRGCATRAPGREHSPAPHRAGRPRGGWTARAGRARGLPAAARDPVTAAAPDQAIRTPVLIVGGGPAGPGAAMGHRP